MKLTATAAKEPAGFFFEVGFDMWRCVFIIFYILVAEGGIQRNTNKKRIRTKREDLKETEKRENFEEQTETMDKLTASSETKIQQ